MQSAKHEKMIFDGMVELLMQDITWEVHPHTTALPCYERYEKAAREWAAIQKRLSRSLWYEYEEELTLDAIAFEKLNSRYFWVMGFVDAVNEHVQDIDMIEKIKSIPDPLGVELRLIQECVHFSNRLEEKYRTEFKEHLQSWKEWTFTCRSLYYQHGLEFAQELLKQSAFGCETRDVE